MANTASLSNKGMGRPKGSKNRSTIARETLLSCADIQEKIVSGELQSPLAFLIEYYSNPENPDNLRIQAAKEVNQYVHKKMPVETNTNITTNSTDQLFQIQLIKPKPPEE